MNIKETLIVVGCALMTTWVIDYFILNRYRDTATSTAQAGKQFNAPEDQHVVKPLNFDITFEAKKRDQEVITEVATDWADLSFSSQGAVLERVEFRHKAGVQNSIITVHSSLKPKQKAFLVAFDSETPYYFTFVSKTETDSQIKILYEGASGGILLRKSFIVDKQECKIDVILDMKGNDKATQVRMLYPAPVMPDITNDAIAALVSNEKGTLEKIPYKKLNERDGWWSPSIFGSENKYFIHALVEDSQHFVERAYYKIDDNQLISILESAPIGNDQVWTLSFYIGPKDAQSMSQVDSRLEEALDYSGILAPLSKLLLKVLNFLYTYVHNYGLAILILTLLIKLIMLPFSMSSEKNLKKSHEMQKKMNYIQQKYKHDPERLRLEQAELIKKHGMPQIASCLPMLAQFPIFIALSRILGNSIELYKAPFLGWITDLSAPDPYYIFPLCIMAGMMIQALYADPKQRMLMMSMGVLFGAFSVNFAAGLALYICASTALGLVQGLFQKRIKVS